MKKLEHKIKPIWPADEASFLSKVFFTWVYPLFRLGRERPLSPDDLYQCSRDDSCEEWAKKLEKKWDKESKKKAPSLPWAVFQAFASKYFLIHCTLGIYHKLLVPIAQTFFLGWILDFLGGKLNDEKFACFSVFGFCFCALSYSLLLHPINYRLFGYAQLIRVSVQKLIMNKLLRLSTSALHAGNGVQLINLVSNDVSRFDLASVLSGDLLMAPFQTLIVSIILWRMLSYAYLVGVAVILVFIGIQSYLGPKSGEIRGKTAEVTDKRINLMSQMVNGIKVVKMYSWEKSFSSKMDIIRKKEAKNIRKACLIWATNLSLGFITTRIILFLCLVTYLYMGNELEPKTVFVTIALLNIIRNTLTTSAAQAATAFCESYASLKRIQKFLTLEEVEHESKQSCTLNKEEEKKIEIKNMSSYWDADCKESCLENISLDLLPGQLLTVVGSVGSGKTSLLLSFLREIHTKSDQMLINGKLSYASQEPWILNTSIRENILFGKPYEEDRYKKVLSATTLDRDIKILHYGDLTLAGERGVALSGGQRARLALARAIYHEADIYLLDDPLSAVDAQVARQIFERCIKDFLKSKIVVLVTHQLQFLSNSDKILFLGHKRGQLFSSLDDFLTSGVEVASSIVGDKTNKDEKKSNIEPRTEACRADLLSPRKVSVRNRRKSSYTRRYSSVSRASIATDTDPGFDLNLEIEEQEPALAEEKGQSGTVSGKTYWKYFKAGAGLWFGFLVLLVNLIAQVLFSVNDMWLAHWTNSLSKKQLEPLKDDSEFLSSNISSNGQESSFFDTFSSSDTTTNTIIYFILVLGLFITTLLRAAMFFQMTFRASINLHNLIFYRILRCPMQMFEENPVGRILNRFSRDLGIVDEQLPTMAFDQVMNGLVCLSVLVVVSTVSWYMLIPALILLALLLTVRTKLAPIIQDLKRIESIVRSPVYSHFTDTADGLAIIRTFQVEDIFQEKLIENLNSHTAAWIFLLASSRSMGVMIDGLTLPYIFLTTILLTVFSVTSSLLPPGSAGLALSQILLLTNLIQWAVRESVEVESYMTSVERVLEYTKLDSEGNQDSNNRPAMNWPEKGIIRFHQVSMKYPSAPKPSLIDVSIDINAGEKIGVVGRTGAGKSSLLSCLFRLVEPEGVIEIDGLDIKNIGLEDLRRKISIIPQEPVIFSGTIRSNLDPFNEHKDSDLWEALEDVQLKEKVSELSGDLEHEIREGGDNFSVGQRQLICLARALLRNNKILVIDEATANVDQNTDHLIQQTIRTKFANCTVLTIAHRLNTIIDFDRILVLDAGRVIEFDEPHILLGKTDSIFSDLVSKTGRAMSQRLIVSAKEAYEKKHMLSDCNRKSGDDSQPIL
ncbi:ATP-binding cassette sub-family C member 4-like [Brevipalpus obovatus]|uniref:ATP-binding cassette sub-family C member 4-like n=1 Tax=Brevipalpus obovatus TaxID=246614 RepID=UPI003D9F3176